MDPPISAEEVFSNLDIFCDWNGNPDEPVGVTINIDVRSLETQKYLPWDIRLTDYPWMVTGVGTPKSQFACSQRALRQRRQGSIAIRLPEDRSSTKHR